VSPFLFYGGEMVLSLDIGLFDTRESFSLRSDIIFEKKRYGVSASYSRAFVNESYDSFGKDEKYITLKVLDHSNHLEIIPDNEIKSLKEMENWFLDWLLTDEATDFFIKSAENREKRK
jgi:hypothetical protein